MQKLGVVWGFAILCGLFLSSCAQHQNTTSTNLVSAKKSLTLNYEKYSLSNGLTVVLHQDSSDPLVHVDVTYHVGSARELPGQSGFAHFFEHMMFQGSKHVADEQHFKLVTQAGGEVNGTTNSDRTNYYQTVPANQLERMLWLESDRMGFLLEAVTQEKFEIQRDTVKNERAQRVDNQPYGLRTEAISQALYPPSHPYSWPTIGYVEDLERVGLADLKHFFSRWYGPNNATLTIGGDIDIEQTKQWINKYFAEIPTGEVVTKTQVTPIKLDQNRYITLEDSIHLPLLQKTLPTVYGRHPDEAPLDVLADILGGGKTSLLYKNLVKTGDAVQAFVSHPCRELACELQIIALANPAQSANLATLEDKIKRTLEEFEQRGVLADDLQRTKASIQANTVFSLQSVAGKVSVLAANQTFYGEPDLVESDLQRYGDVTAEDVMRVYQRYVKGKPSVVLSMVPNGQKQLAAKESNYLTPEREFVSSELNTQIYRTTPNTFDRSVIPPAGPPSIVAIPEYWRSRLNNGVEVLGITSFETPSITVSIAFDGGVLLDPKEKAGLAALTASLMNESTRHRSNEDMANELAKLGSSVSFSATGRYTEITVSALTQHIDATLSLVQEKLFNPAFSEDEFERLRSRYVQSKNQQVNNPNALASQARDTLLFGSENRVSLPDTGTVTTLQSLTLDDVKHFYDNYYTSAKASVVVVGTWNSKQATQALGFLNQLPTDDYVIPAYAPFPTYNQQAIYLVDKPDAVQSVIKLVRREIPFDATGEYFHSRLMNFPLGAAFNSRINLNLREEKSITYGASSGFIGGKSLGWFESATDVNSDSTALAIKEIINEITEYKALGISETELAFMRSAYTLSDALDYETPASKAGFLRQMSAFGLEADFRAKQLAIIESVTQQDINRIARLRLHPDELQIIVVADATIVESQLRALGLPIQTLTLVN